jgi:glycosyltransferase involved in cell wall biosynthesis
MKSHVVMPEHTPRVLMFTESPFPIDTRVRNEALALVEAGYEVTVVAIRYPNQKWRNNDGGIEVYRIPELTIFPKNIRNTSIPGKITAKILAIVGYAAEYVYFTSACALVSVYLLIKQGFDAIHLHNPPNTPFIIGGFYRLAGKKFVFDHHDLAPELYLSRFRGRRKDAVYLALLLEEKICLKFASMVIATNESYRRIQIERGRIDPERIIVVRNGPDLGEQWNDGPDEDLRKKGKNILAYVGVMGPQDGVDYLLRALAHMVHKCGRNEFYTAIIGPGDELENLKALANGLGLTPYVWFTGFIPRGDVIRYLATADICLDPNPSSPLNDSSTWVKVMEYMILGKPIVSFDLPETRYTAQECARYVRPNDEEEFARAVIDLLDNPAERVRMGEFGRRRIYEKLAWQHVSKELIQGYDRFFRNSRQSPH